MKQIQSTISILIRERYVYTDKETDGRKNDRKGERWTNRRTKELRNGRTDEWRYGLADGRTDGWANG